MESSVTGRVGLIICVCLVASACISHVRQPYRPAAPQPVAPAGPFEAARKPVVMHLESLPEQRHYQVQRFVFAATGENGQRDNSVSGRLFSGMTTAARPVVIVLPVWGISEYPSRKFARDLRQRARGAIDIMLVESDGYLIDWEALSGAETDARFRQLANVTGKRMRDMVVDVRRMVDWLSAHESIDENRIGIIGFSLSAVVTALTLQHDPRLAAGVIVMGGSDPAEIFTVCDGRPGQVREAALARFGYGTEEYRSIFREGLAGGDSRDYPGRIADPSRLLFIEAIYDDCMTQASRDGLWEALGRPERIGFRFRHRPAFYAMTPLGFNVLGGYATRFFERTLMDQ